MLPLEGLTVIAVEQAVAAPFCSSRLADAGAHVIKVERPEGDFARGYDAAAKGQSSYFVWLNRGKNSVVIDLATKEGRAALEELIASADVLAQADTLYDAGANYVLIARLAEANELIEAVTAAQEGMLPDMRANLEPRLRDRREVLP